ncbi:hypothetical protein OUZ56_006458 [Daphnia magna]|uniref:Uncharacterized protein n=1 Tax=Daphnia magna TaxID=35525 RepID=A0ABQ9YVQ2_9CRUS|nr:hypothetical protein OUZ56_006458 [Daphnia magna]
MALHLSLIATLMAISLCTICAENIGFNSGVAGGTAGGSRANWDQQQQGQFRPFGSDKPCSVLVNETMMQNDAQVIIERILITADTMGNSFSSSSFTGGSNQQLDTWAAQACGQMQNIVGYLKSACQFSISASSISSTSSTSQTELVAQKKLGAMNAAKEYLCSNNQVNLKELAMNNGAQCARKTDLNEFGCNVQQGAQPTFVQMLPSPNRQTLKYGTSIILSMNSYNNDDCKYVAEITNCILDKYTRGTDFCSSRASTHFGRIFDVMLQGVQCKTGGYSTFNSFDSSNSFNNNPAFNRFPSGSNLPNNQNNFGSNSGSFPQNFPQGSADSNGFNGQGINNFGMNSGGNWPQNQNGFGMNSGSNWPQQNPNSFGMNSGSNWPQQNSGQGSGTFGQSSNNQGQNSFQSSGTIPPYNRRPYNSGNAIQATMTMVVSTIFVACLVP